ncbi:MAG: hypothetical protein D6724_10715 [Armatimonadetes bacterium]|nr:MAG: hypothetical protein D6724_10715 [Armatimonadota bacterium]
MWDAICRAWLEAAQQVVALGARPPGPVPQWPPPLPSPFLEAGWNRITPERFAEGAALRLAAWEECNGR